MNKGNFPLFNAWLKQFTSAVFIQSFHAVFLMFTMIMLSQLQHPDASLGLDATKTDGVVAIVAIACAAALILFEKMIKKLLGIQDSPVGHASAAGAKMFMGAKSAMGLGKTAVGGFKKARDADRNVKDINEKRNKKQDAYDKLYNPTAYNERHPNRPISPQAQQTQNMFDQATSGGQPQGNANNSQGNILDRNGRIITSQQGNTNNQQGNANQQRELDFQRVLDKERREDEMAELDSQEMKAKKAASSAHKDKWLNAAGTMASLSVGFGAADQLSEMLTVANVVNQPLDLITDKYSNKVAGKEVYRESKEKYTNENDRIIRENAVPGAVQQPLKYVDDNGNRNEEARASKLLEKSIMDGLKGGMRDYASNLNSLTKFQPAKLTVEKIITHYDNYESRRERQRQESRNIDNT